MGLFAMNDFFDKIDASKARRIVSYMFLGTVIIYVAAFIAGCVAAARLHMEGPDKTKIGYNSTEYIEGIDSASGGVKFAAVWTLLWTIAVGIFATRILQRYTTPLCVGFLLGCTTILSSHYLVISAVYAFEADDADSDDELREATTAFSFFGVFLFVLFAIFTLFFHKLSHHLIKEDKLEPNEYTVDGNTPNEVES